MFRKFTSERVRRARRRRLVILSCIYGLLALSVFLVLWQFSYAPFLRIDRISVIGARAIPRQDIFDAATPVLSGAYAGIFSKRNRFLVPRGELERVLLQGFPRIRDVAIETKTSRTLEIRLVEHEPEALACRKGSADECYFMNADGYVFSSAPHFFGDSYITYTAALADEPVGKWFLASSGGFPKLHAFARSLEKLSLFPLDVAVSDVALTVTARAQRDPVRFLFSRAMTYEESYRNLDAILHEEDFSLESVESVDLRFGNKVFFREEESL